MDALQLLRDDHRRVKELFRQFSEADDGSTRKAIVDEVIAELMVHAQLEEEIFYPAIVRAGFSDLIAHAEEEHHAAETMMNDLLEVDARDATLAPRFTALADSVREHIDEEESQIFPRAAELGMDRLDRIGDELRDLRIRIMTAAPIERRQPQRRTTGTPSRSGGTRKRTTARAVATRARSATTRATGKATTAVRKTATTARKTAGKAATGVRKTATTARKAADKAATGVRKAATTASKTAKSAARSTTARANGARATNSKTSSTNGRTATRTTATKRKTAGSGSK